MPEGGTKPTSVFLQYLINGLTIGSFYALVALGYTMIYGIIRLINFAHGGFLAIGAYLAFTLIPYIGFWGALLVAPWRRAMAGRSIPPVFASRPPARRLRSPSRLPATCISSTATASAG